jgi:hypothetical protein
MRIVFSSPLGACHIAKVAVMLVGTADTTNKQWFSVLLEFFSRTIPAAVANAFAAIAYGCGAVLFKVSVDSAFSA